MEENSILITGGAGFIGGHIARTLADDTDVTILDSTPDGSLKGIHSIEGDIRDEATVDAALEDVDVVFHEAALVSVEASIDRPKESHAINATGTLNVLEAARKHDARVVFASSAAIYGHPEETPISESHPLQPASPYGLDKLTSDHYVRLYHDLYGLETVALRYFNAYGPGQTGGDYAGVIEVFLEQARAGDPITVNGDGTQTRDFVHVDDIVQANLLAAETDAVGQAFNVGTGESVTVRELAELVRDAVGSDSEIAHIDPRDGDVEHSCADVSRAKRVLGYEPTVELRDGLQSLVDAT